MAEKAWEKKERASSDQPHLQHQDDVAASRFFRFRTRDKYVVTGSIVLCNSGTPLFEPPKQGYPSNRGTSRIGSFHCSMCSNYVYRNSYFLRVC